MTTLNQLTDPVLRQPIESASVELASLQWVHWFNHIRLLGPIGYIPPAEAEENYYRQLADSRETSVSFKPIGLHQTRGDSTWPGFARAGPFCFRFELRGG